MINALEFMNFRGFDELHLTNLKQFNVLFGPNGSGKTAFLEGIFLASASTPEVALRFRGWRGQGTRFAITGERSSFDDLFMDLFWSQTDRRLAVILHDTEKGQRACYIEPESEQVLTLPIGKQIEDLTITAPFVFKWKSGDREHIANVQLSGGELRVTNVPSLFPAIFLPPTVPVEPPENASRYSSISKENKEQEFLEFIQRIYPFVIGISIEMSAGVQTIFAKVEGLARKIPLPNVAGGINKYVGILLAIFSATTGVVLIDEIENGFYHDTLASIWSNIVKAAQQAKAQVFFTTHSMECLRALLPLLEEMPEEFCFLRTRRKAGSCEIEQIATKHIKAAMIEGFEIR